MTEKRSLRAPAALLLGVLLLAQARPARCADEFGEHYRRAEWLKGMGRYEDAVKELRAAYELQRLPRLLFNLGRLHLKLGQAKEALAYYEAYRREAPGPDPEVDRLLAEDLGRARGLVAAGGLLAIEAAPAPKAIPQAAPRRPVYKRWWFWTSLSAGVVAGAVAVTLGALRPWQPADPADVRSLEGKFQ